jgi:predicted dienelactone hydrolase
MMIQSNFKIISKHLLTGFAFFIIDACYGQNNIGQRTFNFMDTIRNRKIITEVWYPTDDILQQRDKINSPFVRQYTIRNGRLPVIRHPLIMMSHGTGGSRLNLEWLAQALVKKGFIVAAVDHWGNTFDNKILIEFVKPWERPLDISFALTCLLNDTSIKQTIDTSKIGAAGFSFGGYTVIALAGGIIDYNTLINYYKTSGKKEIETPEMPGTGKFLNDVVLLKQMKNVPLLKDERIKAFFAISPTLGSGFKEKKQLKSIDKPIYLIGIQSDSLAPVKTNALHYHHLISGSKYFEFSGKTGHYVMLPEANSFVQKEEPLYFTDAVGVNRHNIHHVVEEMAILFFQEKL